MIELDKDFLHPAEYNVKKYNTLAMGDIEYVEEQDSLIVKDIQANITSSIIKSEKFDLIDRSNLENIIYEHKLSSSGLINQESASIIGEAIGAGILITGRLSKNSYTECRIFSNANKRHAKCATTHCGNTIAFSSAYRNSLSKYSRGE